MSVIANRKITPSFVALFVVCTFSSAPVILKTKRITAAEQTIVSFEELLRRPVKLRSGLYGQHPRIFFTTGSLEKLRVKAKTVDHELWQEVLKDVRALNLAPPEPGSAMLDRSGIQQLEGDISQYEVAFIVAEAAFVYSIERESIERGPRYLEAAKRWLLTACKYDPWGYSFRTPNVDLPPAHLLYAVAFAYDALYNDLGHEERAQVRAKLAKQARLMYDYFRYKPSRKYTFSQNHTFIPMAGLGIAAYALMGEESDAEDWARLARAVFDRTLLTFAIDGYYYEGFHYFNFSFRWIMRYLDAHENATGEDLYAGMEKRFAPLKYYVAHSVLPDGQNIFDFGDAGDGAKDRINESVLEVEYDIFYRLAAKYKDAGSQGVADWLRHEVKAKTREKIWAFYAHDARLKPAQMASIPSVYYFPDADTAFWRSGWDRSATAFAFRCGPPAGHGVATMLAKIPEWRLSTGHAHPDANSFIIYSQGAYLTGDTGYTGLKQTSEHNVILVDGRGQEKDGRHEMFTGLPYDRLDKIRIAEVWATPDYFYARGEAAPAYYANLNIKHFDRHFLYVAPDYFVIWDEISTTEPRQFTWLINADREIRALSSNRAEIVSDDAALRVTRVLPANAVSGIVSQVVMARGRPGSIEDGKKEERGLHLVTQSIDKVKEFEFLHFLQPVTSTQATPAGPQVSLAEGEGRGLKILWPNGEQEFVLLRGGSNEIKSDAVRAVVRLSSNGNLVRLILQNGSTLALGAKNIFKSAKPVSAALEFNNQMHGFVSANEVTSLTLNMAHRPKIVRVNGQAVKFLYDTSAHALTIKIGVGRNMVESE